MPARSKTPRPAPPDTIVQIPVTALQISDAIQPRCRLNHEVVEEYATLYREQEDGEPDALPALDVFAIDGASFVVDGFHRHAAAVRTGRATLPCRVRQGTMQDALRQAALANLKSPLPYTNEDKRRVLERLLADPEVGQHSDRAIARDMGLSHVTVGRARQRLAHIADLTQKLTMQPTTGAIPATKRQKQVAALLALPPTDTAILAKHNRLKPDEIVHDIAQRMADRKEPAEVALQSVALQLRSRAEIARHNGPRTYTRGRAATETAEERAERRAANLRRERYYMLLSVLPWYDYLAFTPTADEAFDGAQPHTPSLNIEALVAAVQDEDRADILDRLSHAYTFLDAVKAACQEQGWAL